MVSHLQCLTEYSTLIPVTPTQNSMFYAWLSNSWITNVLSHLNPDPIYFWQQTAADVTVRVRLPEGVAKDEVQFRLTADAISVAVPDFSPLLQGQLYSPVDPEASAWILKDHTRFATLVTEGAVCCNTASGRHKSLNSSYNFDFQFPVYSPEGEHPGEWGDLSQIVLAQIEHTTSFISREIAAPTCLSTVQSLRLGKGSSVWVHIKQD